MILATEGTQTVRTHRISSRPHIQGDGSSLRLVHNQKNLTDGGGLVLLRRLFDVLHLGRWIDSHTDGIAGHFRPGLMVEVWITLLVYGGGVLADLPLLERRGIRRLFGWVRVPDPTTFGRWLRRAGAALVPLLDNLLRQIVQWRWTQAGVPSSLTLVLDSTVAVRYGEQQAGAERGYNPKKPGRPSHHPLLAFVQETGDCLGVRWRPGDAHTAAGSQDWIRDLVGWLRSLGVEDITVRLDKGFFSRAMVETLRALEVSFLLKVPAHSWLRDHHHGPWRRSERGEGMSCNGEPWTASGELWDVRLLSLEIRRPLHEADDVLPLDTYQVTESAHILTNLDGIQVLSAWRRYNQGAVVEQRIKELGQLSVGDTAIDDLDGNALLWGLGTLAYQLLHVLRTLCLTGDWRKAQPKRLRLWLLRLPGKLTSHARKHYLQLLRDEPVRHRLLNALRTLAGALPPPLPVRCNSFLSDLHRPALRSSSPLAQITEFGFPTHTLATRQRLLSGHST